ncbi:hypothetical protein EKG83_25295 [Saccharothrix syringae]|uniref:Uncharacterized protein n=1 Tax=Saccharothrix syringae TaxID=103733 RepID=A0A5Q0H3A1_SACSY|nr:hypothetical protein EKG83_25295 [Saccharothrix syringae]
MLALVGGLLLGVLTNLAQGVLPGAWNQLANSGAVWTVAAFCAGALLSRWGMVVSLVGGLCAECGLVLGYYGWAELGRDGMGDWSWPLVWLAMAFLAGPLFGAAGAWWRASGRRWQRVAGLAVLAGVFGQEGLHYALVLDYEAQAWVCGAVFALVPLLGRTWPERAITLPVAAVLAVLAHVVVGSALGGLSA